MVVLYKKIEEIHEGKESQNLRILQWLHSFSHKNLSNKLFYERRLIILSMQCAKLKILEEMSVALL